MFDHKTEMKVIKEASSAVERGYDRYCDGAPQVAYFCILILKLLLVIVFRLVEKDQACLNMRT